MGLALSGLLREEPCARRFISLLNYTNEGQGSRSTAREGLPVPPSDWLVGWKKREQIAEVGALASILSGVPFDKAAWLRVAWVASASVVDR